VTWTVIMVAAAAALGAAAVQMRGDLSYALVIIWGLSGVAAANSDLLILAAAAWGGGLLLALFMGGKLAARRIVCSI